MSRTTAFRWLRREQEEGLAGLADHSSRPHRSPHALDEAAVQDVLQARVPPSTIYAVLRRHGCSRLRTLDRTTGVPVRYVRERPGELLHLDVKQLARVPDGGGTGSWDGKWAGSSSREGCE